MNILLTGITGFIGSHLAERLVNAGYKVYGIVKYCVSRDLRPLNSIREHIILITADLIDYHSIKNTIKTANPDVIIHLAALTPVRESFERPYEYQQTNFLGTMNVINSLLELPDSKERGILAASTAEVYGFQKSPKLTEDLPLNPTSPYAVSKAAAELYLRMVFHNFNLKGCILRPTNTYGRKFDKSFIVEYLVTEMLKGNHVYIGAPESIRDYMYVEDHIAAYMMALEKIEKLSGEVFNAGTGVGIKNKDLAKKIAAMLGFEENKIILGTYPPGYPFRPLISDQPHIILDSTKIKKHLGWEAKVDLDSGLRKVIDYWKDKV